LVVAYVITYLFSLITCDVYCLRQLIRCDKFVYLAGKDSAGMIKRCEI